MAMIFTKPVTKTDFEVKLAVPNDRLGAFAIPSGEHSVEFDAIDSTGRAWPFRLSTWTKGTSLKTFLDDEGGWLAFVRKEGLAKGDKVIFHGETDEAKELRFRIQLVERSSA